MDGSHTPQKSFLSSGCGTIVNRMPLIVICHVGMEKYGVATEICAECAARGLITRGYTVDVVGDAMQRLDTTKSRSTIAEV